MSAERRTADRRVSPAVGEFAIQDSARLREELAGLRKDAERYRWLRENPNFMGWEPDFMAHQVDAAIDDAIDTDRMSAGFGEALELTRKAVEP